jgi:hypothetical protein
MDKPEHWKMLREWPGAGKERLENAVGDRRSHRLGDESVKSGPPGPAGNYGDGRCYAHPEFSVVGGSGKPAEKLVMVSARQA